MYNHEWYNLNGNRRFPIVSTATMAATTGKIVVSNNVFVDAMLSMSLDFESAYIIKSIKHTPELLVVTIAKKDEPSIIIMQGTLILPISDYAQMTMYGQDLYYGSAGKFIIGTLDDLPYGQFEFTDMEIEPCRVLKLTNGIASLNGIKQGAINLTTGSNAVITVSGQTIKLDTFDGLCACNDNPCIKTINGIEPINENFTVNGLGCVKVDGAEGGIGVSNICEEACCGCAEINDFVDQLNDLQKRIMLLERG